MSPNMLKAAAAGKVEFLIDQQQYLQGYLPIAIFGQYMRYGTMPAGVVMTGPGFVTPDNAAKAVSYTHLRAHETSLHLVCRLLLEKKK